MNTGSMICRFAEKDRSFLKRTAALLCITLTLALPASADNTLPDGGRVVCKDGVCMIVEPPSADAAPAAEIADEAPRIAQGYMGPEEFIAFLKGESPQGGFAGKSIALVILLVLLGGLAMNLTPCVLPMMPVNLMIVGRSAVRGAWYGAGIAIAYGTLGVLAAAGGMAFGEIQGSAWFNALVSAVFLLLSLSLLDVFLIDFSRLRSGGASLRPSRGGVAACAFAFFMGALSAVLAGACVAPVLISVMIFTASLYSRGYALALALPFVMGLGMALPWPFAAAGLKVLPKPGAWMKQVNRVFAVVVMGFAVWHGYLAFKVIAPGGEKALSGSGAVTETTPEEFAGVLAGMDRPVLVDCWASWCKNCTAMEKTTLKDFRVIEELKGYRVIRLRAEDIRALRALKGFETVKGLPAFAVFR